MGASQLGQCHLLVLARLAAGINFRVERQISPLLASVRSRVMLFSDGNIASRFDGLHSRHTFGSKKVSSTRYPINWIGKVLPKQQNTAIRF
jgi:hypothetical protein